MQVISCSNFQLQFKLPKSFKNLDEKFINDLIGMKPNSDLHDFILSFEPVIFHQNTYFLTIFNKSNSLEYRSCFKR
jgi:hypothetical protein